MKKEEPKYITVKEPCSLCDGTGETTFSGTYTTQRKCDLCNGERYWNKKILIEEPKQEHCDCKRAYKEALSGICELCWDEKYPTKQETLEEDAERLFPNSSIQKRIFKMGSKYQAERMYSEEEVKSFLDRYRSQFRMDKNIDVKQSDFIQWFEQFKKK